MQKRLQSLVVITLAVIIVSVVAIRTKYSWSSFARQNLREVVSSELLVLSHLLTQKAQTLEDAYVSALNKKPNPNVKIIYSRVLQKSENGHWSLVDTQEVPGSGAYFAKQIPENFKPTGKQWMRLSDSKGESYAGLLLPVAAGENGIWRPTAASDAKTIVFAVFKDPFGDIVEIFKGAGASFIVLDNRNFVMAHSTEEYQGMAVAKDIQRLIDTYRLESFVERKAGKKAGGYIGIQKVPELNLVLAAELPGNLVGMKFYRWLFEFIAGGILFTALTLFALGRRRQFSAEVSEEIVAVRIPSPKTATPAPITAAIPTPALPQKDFVIEEPEIEKPQGRLEKLMNLAAGMKNKKTKPTPPPIQTQVTGFQSQPTMVTSPILTLETANLRPLLITLLAEAAHDIRVYGVEVEDKIDEVPEVNGSAKDLQQALAGLMKLTFYGVRQKMAKKVKIRLQRLGKSVELILSDNGLPRKTNEDALLTDIINYPELVTAVSSALQNLRRLKAEIQMRYDFHNGNQIIVRLPVGQEKAPPRITPNLAAQNSEEIKKRFNQFQIKNIAINVRKPKIKEIEND